MSARRAGPPRELTALGPDIHEPHGPEVHRAVQGIGSMRTARPISGTVEGVINRAMTLKRHLFQPRCPQIPGATVCRRRDSDGTALDLSAGTISSTPSARPGPHRADHGRPATSPTARCAGQYRHCHSRPLPGHIAPTRPRSRSARTRCCGLRSISPAPISFSGPNGESRPNTTSSGVLQPVRSIRAPLHGVQAAKRRPRSGAGRIDTPTRRSIRFTCTARSKYRPACCRGEVCGVQGAV